MFGRPKKSGKFNILGSTLTRFRPQSPNNQKQPLKFVLVEDEISWVPAANVPTSRSFCLFRNSSIFPTFFPGRTPGASHAPWLCQPSFRSAGSHLAGLEGVLTRTFPLDHVEVSQDGPPNYPFISFID